VVIYFGLQGFFGLLGTENILQMSNINTDAFVLILRKFVCLWRKIAFESTTFL